MTRVEQAKHELTILARTEDKVRVAFTMLVAGTPKATDLGFMSPTDALIAFTAAANTAASFNAPITSVTVFREE